MNNIEFAEIVMLEIKYIITSIDEDFFPLIERGPTGNLINILITNGRSTVEASYEAIENDPLNAEEHTNGLRQFLRLQSIWGSEIIRKLNNAGENENFDYWFYSKLINIISKEEIFER